MFIMFSDFVVKCESVRDLAACLVDSTKQAQRMDLIVEEFFEGYFWLELTIFQILTNNDSQIKTYRCVKIMVAKSLMTRYNGISLSAILIRKKKFEQNG